MSTQYDKISKVYKRSKTLPFRPVEEHTIFEMIGDVQGKSVLDLACGQGYYTRLFKHKGATKVVGVDVSLEMIKDAQAEEAKNPLDIQYICEDVQNLPEIGQFDLVTAIYLLNYVPTKAILLQICQVIFANLKPNGRFITYTDNINQPVETYADTAKYGFVKEVLNPPRQEGGKIRAILFLEEEDLIIEVYYLRPETYEWAFKMAGFKDVYWHPPALPDSVISEFGPAFWQDFVDNPAMIGIELRK